MTDAVRVRIRSIPNLRRYFTAYTADTSADLLWYVILAWSAGGNGAAAGAILCAGIIPAIVLAPFGGVLADRLGASRAIRYTLSARIITMLAWGVALLSGAHLTAWSAALAAFVIGVIDGLHQPTLEIWPMAVTAESPDGVQTRLYATERIVGRVSQAFAGIAGGTMLARWGEGAPTVLAAILFLLALVTFAHIPLSDPVRDEPAEPSAGLLRGARAGFKETASDPVLAMTVPIHGLFNALTAGVVLAAIPIRAREAGWSAGWFGAQFGVWGLGLLAGTLLMLQLTSRVRHKVRLGLCCAIVTGMLVTAIAIAKEPATVTMLIGLAGISSGPVGPCLGGYLREQIRRHPNRGAIAGVQSFFLDGLEPLGYLAVGLVAGTSGAAWSIEVAGVVVMVAALFGLGAQAPREAVS